MKKNLILIGLMGTGKTTVGQALANLTNWHQVDCDQWLVNHYGMTIPFIFKEYGEEKFRQMETESLTTILQGDCQIVMTGGGAPLREDNRRIMVENGLVIALQATAETIIERVKMDQNRPLLEGNLVERVNTLVDERKGVYDFAQIQIQTDGKTIEEIVAELKGEINKRIDWI
ncbi:shikimate kinase [Ammoniphilus resinae]|uniref:Shikimate kinase n=1 Tax=Ammoniphilus resinae TaxID=861532 RepID=A0ABS4GRD2_9BACL|nr:shikimate kinase [Ammoniphilus resinae]MBP1932824.1 shikimate kinase [Ammoniphilus resinae]